MVAVPAMERHTFKAAAMVRALLLAGTVIPALPDLLQKLLFDLPCLLLARGDQDRFAEWPVHFHQFSSLVPSFTHLLFCSGKMIVAELYRIRKPFLHDGFPCAWSGNAIDNMSAASPLRKGWVRRILGYCLILFQIRYN